MARKVVLVTSDDERELLEAALGELPDYQIDHCRLAEDTISCLRRASPDLVVAMLKSPDIAGINFIRLLRDDPTTVDIPIVVCAARAPILETLAGELQGMGLYVLYLPFTPQDLRAKVAEVFSK